MAATPIEADLKYLQRLSSYFHEPPFRRLVPAHPSDPDQRINNLAFETHRTKIANIRDSPTPFTLDEHGFQVATCPTQLSWQQFEDANTVEDKYFNELDALLRRLDPSINHVFFADWRLRSADAPPKGPFGGGQERSLPQPPAQLVHVDQSSDVVLERLRARLGRRAEFLLRGRVRVVTIWRPLEYEVQDYPLAVCEGASVLAEDLKPCTRIRHNNNGQTLLAHHNEGQKWHYVSRQKPEEILLMKMYDSNVDVRAKLCPHTSFRDPNCGPNPLPRKSIEVRAMIINFPAEFNARMQRLGVRLDNVLPNSRSAQQRSGQQFGQRFGQRFGQQRFG